MKPIVDAEYAMDLVGRAKSLMEAALVAALYLYSLSIGEAVRLRFNDFILTTTPDGIEIARLELVRRYSVVEDGVEKMKPVLVSKYIPADELLIQFLGWWLVFRRNETSSEDFVVFPITRQEVIQIIERLEGGKE